nr:unnamed protein product [uncultured archaeal virus]
MDDVNFKEAIFFGAAIAASSLLQSAMKAAIEEEKEKHKQELLGEHWRVDLTGLKKVDFHNLFAEGKKKKSKRGSKLERQRELGMI